MKRRSVREKVMQTLYALEISREPVEQVVTQTLQGFEDDATGRDFAHRLITETVRHSADIDEAIKERVDNWDFKRIAVLDRVILRMAICELTHFNDIPPKVSVNEAIELAKKYSTEKSGKFVNGVLDALLSDMKKAGEIHKTGRGLFEGGSEPQRTSRRTKV